MKISKKLIIILLAASLLVAMFAAAAQAKPEMSPDKKTCTPCHSDGRTGDGKGGTIMPGAATKPAAQEPAKQPATTAKPAAPAPKAVPAAKTVNNVTFQAFGKTSTVLGTVSGSTVLVPLREVASIFFALVDWDNKAKTATVTSFKTKAVIAAGKATATLSGKEIKTTTPKVVGGKLLIPADLAAQIFGTTATGDATSGVSINAGAAGYAGPQTCAKCHQSKYDAWMTTKHATMIQDASKANPVNIANFDTNKFFKYSDVRFIVAQGQRYVTAKDGKLQYLNATWDPEKKVWVEAKPSDYGCGQCHNTGFNAKTNSWAFNGITCESCHGPGADHAKTGDKTKIKLSYGNDACSSCHGQAAELEGMGKAHAGADGVPKAGHANHFKEAVDNPASPLANHYGDNCMKCHSVTVFRAVSAGKTPPKLEDFKTGALKNDRNGITCVVCHSPHKATANEYQLRKDPYSTCVQCHTNDGDLASGKAPHHPQKEFFEGQYISGGQLQKSPSSGHVDCASCHMANGNHLFKTGTPDITLSVHGKDSIFEPCASCHTTQDGKSTMTKERLEEFQKENQERLATINADWAKITEKKASLSAASLATYNDDVANKGLLEAEGSSGVHNPAGTKLMLNKLEQDISAMKAELGL